MRGKKISGARDRQGEIEWLLDALHVRARSLQHCKRGVALVEVAHFRLQAQRLDQLPAANAENLFLFQPQFGTAAVQFTGDAAVLRDIRGIVGVQQIQFCSAYLRLPHTDPKLGTGQIYWQPQPLTIRLAQGLYRQLAGVVEGIQRHLLSVRVYFLAKISLLVQQADPLHRNAEVAGRFQLIAGDVAKSSRINRQGFTQHKFHGEVGNRRKPRARVRLLKPPL